LPVVSGLILGASTMHLKKKKNSLVYKIVGLMGERGCHGRNLSRFFGRLLTLSMDNNMFTYRRN